MELHDKAGQWQELACMLLTSIVNKSTEVIHDTKRTDLSGGGATVVLARQRISSNERCLRRRSPPLHSSSNLQP
eukprot:999370-Pelagomonas_calceolata.AAC.2